MHGSVRHIPTVSANGGGYYDRAGIFHLSKGLPLVRKDNTIYYGNMSDKYVAMLTVLSTHKVKDLEQLTRQGYSFMSTGSENPWLQRYRKDERKRQSREALLGMWQVYGFQRIIDKPLRRIFTAERFYAYGFNDAP